MAEIVYYGEIKCESSTRAGPCTNGAYYEYRGSYLCGVHCRSGDRNPLPKRSAKEKAASKKASYEAHMETVEDAAESNRKAKIPGDVALVRMRMRKRIEFPEGWFPIFPNYWDGDREDGYGCPSLSPMTIGPIDHGQPGLPKARNLENFWQSNKVTVKEADKKGNPTELFHENQLRLYRDAEPHRHKYKGEKVLYSRWIQKDGTELRLNYVESRQIYGHFYELGIKKSPDFKYLKELLKEGYNLAIYGYDAYDIAEDFETSYLDPSEPFGHERCLAAMLLLKPKDYPWRRHQTIDF